MGEIDLDNDQKALYDRFSKEVQEYIDECQGYRACTIDRTVLGKDMKKYLKDTGKTPSQYFKEHQKYFAGWISDEYLEDFYYCIDNTIYWQDNSSDRQRALRDRKYENNICFIGYIFRSFREEYKTESLKNYCEFRIAAELDKGNKELEEYLLQQIKGAGGDLSEDIIRGIVLSKCERLYEALGELLLSAGLQEGLRDSICSNMDCGREEAFLYLYKLVLDNDLIRFDAVSKAAYYWTGLYDSDMDLSKISKRQVELFYLYLTNEKEREKALCSQDPMELFIALWSLGWHDWNIAHDAIEKILRDGTPDQWKAALYLPGVMYKECRAFADAIKLHDDDNELMAIAVDKVCFMVDSSIHRMLPSFYFLSDGDIKEANRKIVRCYPEVFDFLGDIGDYEEIWHHLENILPSIPKKDIEFKASVFPWNDTKLDKTKVIMCMAYFAGAAHNDELMDKTLTYIDKVDSDERAELLAFLAAEPTNEIRKKAVRSMVSNQDDRARAAAFQIMKFIELEKADYDKLEDTLRLKKPVIRKKCIEFLYRLKGQEMEELLKRLFADKLLERRLGGFDILLLLKKDESRQEEYRRFAGLAKGIKDPTDQEKVLLEEISVPAGDEEKENESVNEPSRETKRDIVLIEEPDASYEPVIDMAWIEEAKKVFSKVFTKESQFDQHFEILKALNDVIDLYKDMEVKNSFGETTTLECTDNLGYVENEVRKTYLEEVWRDFYLERIGNYETLLKLYMIITFDQQEEYAKYFEPALTEAFGDDYTRLLPVKLSHEHAVWLVIHYLENKYRDTALLEWLAGAVTYHFLYEYKEPFVYRYTEQYQWETEPRHLHRSIFDHFTLTAIMKGYVRNDAHFDKLFPLQYEAAERAEIASEENESFFYSGRYTMRKGLPVPAAQEYIKAFGAGLISEGFLYKMIFDVRVLKDNVKLLSDYVRNIRDKGRCIAGRREFYRGRDPEKELFYSGDDPRNEKLAEIACKAYDRVSTAILETELKRGEMYGEYSRVVGALTRVYGTEYFVRLIVALANSKLERTSYGLYTDKPTRIESICYLLSICIPKQGENVETLREELKGKKISDKRLLEAALYSPEWVEIVGDYLGWEGFISGSYYFMAHMNEEFDEKRTAIIARYTPLSTDALANGAFDSNWFKESFEALGEEHFKSLYDSCKYITSGAKHVRARKYADAALGRLDIKDVMKEASEKRNKDSLMALGIIPTESADDLKERYVFIRSFEKESRHFGAQRRSSEKLASEIAIENMAISNGYTDSMRFILKMESMITEGLLGYFAPVETGDVKVWLEASSDGKVEVIYEKAGKELKSVPAALKKDPYILELTEAKKELSLQCSRARVMFENAMEEESEFTLGEIRALTTSPVINPIVNRLVYKLGDEYGFLSDLTDKSDSETLIVAHPYHMFKSGVWHDFQKRIYDQQMVQPFKQVFRELYVKTAEESSEYDSPRFEGCDVHVKHTLGVLKSRQWVADVDEGLQKVYYRKNIIASVYAYADWFSASGYETTTVGDVHFLDRKTSDRLKIEEVPDILFSETMRDVDLAVSVAHVGETDPEISASAIDLRKAIAEFTLPLFKLTNVSFTERHAHIEGKRGTYDIHLGSGTVLLGDKRMLNVVPAGNNNRGKLFLPFVDDDPKTAEVISKILLFAEDEKIKDPAILEQL